MERTSRILIFTPRLRHLGRALASVARARSRYAQPLDVLEVEHDPPVALADLHDPQSTLRNGGLARVLTHYQHARRVALADECYTHLLCIEDDMVIPPDTIDRLLACDAPVAYGLYCWRWGPPHLWSAYRWLFFDSGASWSDDEPHTAAHYFETATVREVAGVGFGCTLIRRDVLLSLDFRIPDDGTAANDWYFAHDCQRNGIRQVCDFGCVCGHIRLDPSARVIWPAVVDGKAAYRYEYFEV